MQAGKPSRTALAAAIHRAAHQVLEQGRIFHDPLAVRILGEHFDQHQERTDARRMRIFIAARTRFAEDALAVAVERGVSQLVVLGAGLDTYAYRNPYGARLRVFEVDHPATQQWKRERLAAADVPIPPSLVFAPVDFERQTLSEGLAAAGFDPTQRTFFTWLGVVPYLSAEAVWSTLSLIAGLRGGSHVVFDYANPPETLSPEARAFHDRRAARVAALGEAWVSYFETDELHAKLRALGFTEIEDLGPREIVTRYLPGTLSTGPQRGGHIVRATSGSAQVC